MVRKLLKNSIALSLIIFLMTGCLKTGNETIALPSVGTANNVIPEDIRQEFGAHMSIYEGTNPPDITGTFKISPMKLFYASDADHAPSSFADKYIAFYNKQGNTYEYKSKTGSQTGQSPLVTVIGSGDSFTAYFTERTKDDDGESWSVHATLISGTLTTRGIENIKYAFIMLDANDPNNKIMEINEYRVFYDGDGLANYENWDYTKSTNEVLPSSGLLMCNSSAEKTE